MNDVKHEQQVSGECGVDDTKPKWRSPFASEIDGVLRRHEEVGVKKRVTEFDFFP